MRAACRLAIRSLSARPWRSGLLTCAVALSAALIAGVACAIASANQALDVQLGRQVGEADVRLTAAGANVDFPASYVDQVRAWPEVASARAELQATIALSIEKAGLVGRDGGFVRQVRPLRATALAHGIDPGRGGTSAEIIHGRRAHSPGEVALDALTAERLSWNGSGQGLLPAQKPIFTGNAEHLTKPEPAVPVRTESKAEAEAVDAAVGVRVGDALDVFRLFRPHQTLKVVGIVAPPPLGGRPQVWLPREDLESITGRAGLVSLVEMTLAEGVDPEEFVLRRQAELGDRFLIQTTAKVRSGAEKNVASSQLGFVLISVLCFLSAAFIIMTGLNTGLAEQRRSLAVLRCVGATAGQLGQTQLLIGLMVGSVGAVVGVPLGVGVAWVLVRVFHQHLPTGLAMPVLTLMLAGAGAIATGVLGAVWPAWQATRLSPMAALTSRADPVSRTHVQWTLFAGLLCLLAQALIVGLPRNGQVVFWGYATVGLPAMFVGYFLLGVPLVVLMTRMVSPGLSRLLGLPHELLGRNMRATPYRYGFTAGAMMGGLALLVAIWTNSGGFLRDWIGRIRFPDAFVSGIALSPASQQRLDELPFVKNTCAITLYPVTTNAFGVHALQTYKTTFVAFEPEAFFEMTELDWIEGDPETAKARLEEGGAVIVAREFKVAQGLGVGDKFLCSANGKDFQFDIVGVVTSPGLELISKFFNVGEEYVDQSLHAVFGSRRDLVEKFGTEAIALIQIDLSEDISDEAALVQIRDALFGAGVLDVGSGRQIRDQLTSIVLTFLTLFSVIAVLSMLIACLGVANVVAASIHARRFEFGVLRAVGAQRSLLVRMVLGEAVIIALAAGILGTAMGQQGAWAGRRLNALLLGLEMELHPVYWVIAGGIAVVALFSIGAALPAILNLNRNSPRELLSARIG